MLLSVQVSEWPLQWGDTCSSIELLTQLTCSCSLCHQLGISGNIQPLGNHFLFLCRHDNIDVNQRDKFDRLDGGLGRKEAFMIPDKCPRARYSNAATLQIEKANETPILDVNSVFVGVVLR